MKINSTIINSMKFRLARARQTISRRFWWLIQTLLGPLKDALLEIRVNSGLMISLLGKIAWLTPLISFRHVFATFPGFYRDFQNTGPEWAWALAFLFFVCCDCVGIIRRVYEWQVACLVLGAMLWLTLCKLVAAGVPHGDAGLPSAPTAYMYLFAGTGCLIAAYRLIHQHGARQEAMQFLIITKRIEAERANGAAWAQDKTEDHQIVNAQETKAVHAASLS